MSSVRERIEAQQLAAKYAVKLAPQITKEAADERRDRLAQNARKINEDRLNVALLDMTDSEREAVFEIMNRERPSCLSSFDVISATLLRVRTEGVDNLREAMQDTTQAEQLATWEILKHATSEDKLGMDGGRACREALAQAREKLFMEEN
jgi:hypothetical protein